MENQTEKQVKHETGTGGGVGFRAILILVGGERRNERTVEINIVSFS